MKPDFALNLSFDGITLLQRVTGGWAELGAAGFDGDLGEAMQSLLATAEAADPNGAHVKLIVPNDQIKYLDVPADGPWDDDRVQIALDGATPYLVDQLAYDWAETAGQVHIAAVAQDTLQEAEAFALEHGFRPASFVAIPPAGAFGREVFLGQSDSWTGDAQTGPEDAIVIVPMPEPVVAPDPEPEPEPEPMPEPEAVVEEAAPEVDDVAATPDEPEVEAPEVEAEVEAEAEAEAEDSIDTPEVSIEEPVDVEATETPSDTPEPETEPESEPEQVSEPDAPAPAAPVAAAVAGAVGTASAQVFSSVRDTAPSADASSDLAKTEPKLSITSQNLRVTDGAIADAAAPKLGAAGASVDDAHIGAAPKVAAPGTAPQDSAPAPVFPSAGKAPQLKAEPIDKTGGKLDEPPVAATSSLTKPRPDADQPAQAEQKKAGFGFFTRRSKTAAVTEQPVAEPAAAMMAEDVPPAAAAVPETKKSRRAKKQEAKKAAEERERLTIFGARSSDVKVGGKPRFLGLMLTTLLLLFLAGVAAWASVFLDDGLARFFREDTTEVAALPDELIEDTTSDAQTEMAYDDEVIEDESQEFEVAALAEPEDTASDITEIDPDLPTALSEPIRYEPLTEEEAQATYAATGIWLRGPSMPALITTRSTDDVYSPSIDPNVEQHDAVALPASLNSNEPLGFDAPISPLPANTVFKLDDRGLVIATLEGAMNPDGVRIFSGQPPTIPPLRGADGQVLVPSTNDTDTAEPGVEQAALEPLTETLKRLQGLAPVRPNARPADIIEQNERANNAGRTLSELAKLRPLARPNSPQQDTAEDVEATAQAIVASLHPMPRPRDISSIVSKAQKAPQPAAPQQVAAVAPRTVKPAAPSSNSVAKQATVKNALNLRKINLIGVYGQPSSRRALVRLGNGQYKKVKVGDRIDGGRVSAIGESELRYTKGGRSISLKMPKG